MNVAVLVSGGVDSAVALNLLKQQGHQVTAYYLKIWLEDELSFLGNCPWQEDLEYVRAVCEQAGVELKVVPFQQEYHETVVKYALDEVKRGATPNPDMLCNTMIKFGAFYDTIGKQYDKIATGHYANVVEKEGIYYLQLTPDPIKDQTYFLARLSQQQLSHVVFPIGKYTKQQVRELAQKFDLPNKDRKDSQGLCFLGKIKFSDFIKEYIGTKPGNLVEFETGKILAEHEGFWFYTIGQRKGIGLSHGPWYVVDKDPEKNIVYISNNYYANDKKRNTFYIKDGNWFAGSIAENKELLVKLRHGATMHHATVNKTEQGLLVTLKEQDQGIASGQFAVFYDGDLCLGCAVITRVGE